MPHIISASAVTVSEFYTFFFPVYIHMNVSINTSTSNGDYIIFFYDDIKKLKQNFLAKTTPPENPTTGAVMTM
jgi:hypothetical protein